MRLACAPHTCHCPSTLRGFSFPLHSGLALILLPPLAYYTGYLQVDVDSFGGGQELLTEALMPSVALFVLTWTAVYNALHLTSEDILQPYPA